MSQRVGCGRTRTSVLCSCLVIAVAAPAEADEPSRRDPWAAAGLGLIGFGLGHYYAGDQGSGNSYLIAESGLLTATILFGGDVEWTHHHDLLADLDDNPSPEDLARETTVLDRWGLYFIAKSVFSIFEAVDAYHEARQYNRAATAGLVYRPVQPAFGLSLSTSRDEWFGRSPLGLGRPLSSVGFREPTWELRLDPLGSGAMLGYRGSF